MTKLSVAMCTYNGEQYVYDQVASVLNQLKECDEIHISDDGSTDGTLKILNQFANGRNIIVHENNSGKPRGIVKNFEFAMSQCKNNYILLADQDDCWVDGKIERYRTIASNSSRGVLIFGEITLADADLLVVDRNVICNKIGNSKPSFWRVFKRNCFVGSTMCFPKSALSQLAPIPSYVPMHDWYIGLYMLFLGRDIEFVRDVYVLHRRHGANNSSIQQRSLVRVIVDRVLMLAALCHRISLSYLSSFSASGAR